MIHPIELERERIGFSGFLPVIHFSHPVEAIEQVRRHTLDPIPAEDTRPVPLPTPHLSDPFAPSERPPELCPHPPGQLLFPRGCWGWDRALLLFARTRRTEPGSAPGNCQGDSVSEGGKERAGRLPPLLLSSRSRPVPCQPRCLPARTGRSWRRSMLTGRRGRAGSTGGAQPRRA